MENIMAWVGVIMIVIFTCINLSILHKRVFCIYFSGQAIFREICLAIFIAVFEAGFVFKIFTGVFGVVFSIIKFILKVILVLAIIAAVGFLLSIILPKILPKTEPVMTKILSLINDKLHIFVIKPNKMEDDNAETDKEGPIPEENQNGEDTAADDIMRCSKCGKPLLKGALFCQACGVQVYSGEPVSNAATSK